MNALLEYVTALLEYIHLVHWLSQTYQQKGFPGNPPRYAPASILTEPSMGDLIFCL